MTFTRTTRTERLLIAAFLGLAALAASALTSIGHPETQLTERSQAQTPVSTGDSYAVDAVLMRMARRE
jgi:hypothetical protein